MIKSSKALHTMGQPCHSSQCSQLSIGKVLVQRTGVWHPLDSALSDAKACWVLLSSALHLPAAQASKHSVSFGNPDILPSLIYHRLAALILKHLRPHLKEHLLVCIDCVHQAAAAC